MNLSITSKKDLIRREKHKKKSKSGGFESLGLSPNVYRGIKRKGYTVPTPIQREAMPLILSGHDVVAMARTGSGKTAAFLVPMLEKLKQHVPQGGVRGLILSPTRELALQTLRFCQELGRFTDLRMSKLVGGDSMERQFEELARNPDIIIATPGRLMHHLSEVDDMSLRTVQYVVFDEADSLFGMGFAEQLHIILEQLSEDRQTLLFSATLPSALAEFAKAGLRDHRLVRLDLEDKLNPDLQLTFFTLRNEEKHAALMYLIREKILSDQQTLIFVATTLHADFLYVLFQAEGIQPSICHGKMDQDARMMNVARFKLRKTMLLIVTDVGAKGIDIPLLDNVVNWNFPRQPKDFVHKVGRVARAGRPGAAYSFVTADDMAYLLDLHLFLSKPIRPAPSEEEVLKDIDRVLAEVDDVIINGETVYGRFPQIILDRFSDSVREIIDGSTDLLTLQKTCENAFRLYLKTKRSPSKESIRRAKALPREGLHPLFKQELRSNELTALAFSERLKQFRPKQTVLEAEGESAKAKHLKGLTSQWVDIMKKKRAVHERVINLVQQKRSSDKVKKSILEEVEPASTFSEGKGKKVRGTKRKASCYKDEEYFISSVPTNQHMEAGLAIRGNEGFGAGRLDTAVLDLVGDDNASMQKQKSVYHWDKRSKKYIKLNNGDRVTASGKIKTESGSKVQVTKTGIYKRWKERSHKKVSLKGTDSGNGEDYRGGYSGRNRDDYRNNYKGRKKCRKIANSHVPSELKNLDKVRKKRQYDANKMAYMKNKPQKGGGRGMRGGDAGEGDFKGKGSRGDGCKGKNKSGKNGGRKGKSY